MLDAEKISLLEQPLDMAQIKHREGGGGRQLAYISGKFAMDQANRIFGYGQWGYKVVNRGHLVIEGADGSNGSKRTMYTADVELWVAGAEFTFPGAGVGIVTKPFTVEAHEKAYKEAETDAMKRALRHYGDQFGLCLYDGEDYVDAGNGEMVQVKNVPVQHGKAQAPRRPAALATEATATEQQLSSIRKLCQHLGKREPDNVTSISFLAAKRLIEQLTAEYKESRPEPASKELVEQARKLCQQLGREVPEDLEKKSSKVIRTILEQMTGSYRDLHNRSQAVRPLQPTSTVNAPEPAALHERAKALKVNLEQVVIRALKANKPDGNWSPEDCAQIARFLNNIEEQRKNTAQQKAS